LRWRYCLPLASLILTVVILYDPIHSELPSNVFLMPTIGLFSFKILRGLWLYQARVTVFNMESLGASLTGLALTLCCTAQYKACLLQVNRLCVRLSMKNKAR